MTQEVANIRVETPDSRFRLPAPLGLTTGPRGPRSLRSPSPARSHLHNGLANLPQPVGLLLVIHACLPTAARTHCACARRDARRDARRLGLRRSPVQAPSASPFRAVASERLNATTFGRGSAKGSPSGCWLCPRSANGTAHSRFGSSRVGLGALAWLWLLLWSSCFFSTPVSGRQFRIPTS